MEDFIISKTSHEKKHKAQSQEAIANALALL
jgi:hypothetical protein